MAALDSLDSIDFGSLNWDNEEDVDAFLEKCKIEEDTQSYQIEDEPSSKRSKQEVAREHWSLVYKAVKAGVFSSKNSPFLRDIVKTMRGKHVGAIIVADCHSAAYTGINLNDRTNGNYFLLGQSNNTYSYVFDGATDKFSNDVLRDLSKLQKPFDTLQSLQVIFPHFNEVKQDAIQRLQASNQSDPDTRAFILSKQVFATSIDNPYLTTLERDGVPGVPEPNKYIKLKYLHDECECMYRLDENFFDVKGRNGQNRLKWDSGLVLNTVTLAPDMITILIMFGCSRNIDGSHDAYQSHAVPSLPFSSLRVLPPVGGPPLEDPFLGGGKRRPNTKRRRLTRVATKRPMFGHSAKCRRKRTVHLFRR